ncbi:hypothetical protein WA026_017156 [Henosepilachna vigintioctopunctata]|uniref:UDP-glucuronosyltransferase n=1 Tax=Henosepilachna vigintioctopunctata TaxID=420089 RepID=A0AAW1UMB3_9CUCU
MWGKIKKAHSIFNELLTYQMSHPDLKRFTNPQNYNCDLILAEVVFPNYYLLGKILDCPLISISSMDAFPYVHNSMGNAIHPVMYGYIDFPSNKHPNFKDRLRNSFLHIIMTSLTAIYFRVLDRYVEQYIGKNLPKVSEMSESSSLLIVNANPIFHPIRPSTPLTINVGGGLHLQEPKSLPKDIQTYLDEAKDGCIYFSFGSTVNSNYLSQETLEIFRKTFQELAPLKVLWKFENDTMPNKPENVHLRKWLPQQDILRHPNVKAFITQGGLQSMEEAIDSAVPMLGMPFYGDQINNVKKMVDKGFGLKLEVKTMDSNSLKNSILELLNNPKYKKNIDRLSAISKDQPMRPLEKAVWWIEYVLRHKTTEHLRSPSADIPLYQYFFLDILAFS